MVCDKIIYKTFKEKVRYNLVLEYLKLIFNYDNKV